LEQAGRKEELALKTQILGTTVQDKTQTKQSRIAIHFWRTGGDTHMPSFWIQLIQPPWWWLPQGTLAHHISHSCGFRVMGFRTASWRHGRRTGTFTGVMSRVLYLYFSPVNSTFLGGFEPL
jgi:hypothetical protein